LECFGSCICNHLWFLWYLISVVRYPLIRASQQFPQLVTGARGRQCPRFGNRSAPLGSIASRRGVPVPRGDLMAIAIWVQKKVKKYVTTMSMHI
jgi:hypothetical protein